MNGCQIQAQRACISYHYRVLIGQSLLFLYLKGQYVFLQRTALVASKRRSHKVDDVERHVLLQVLKTKVLS